MKEEKWTEKNEHKTQRKEVKGEEGKGGEAYKKIEEDKGKKRRKEE